MTDQLIIEPEARLLVELGQERGVLYEDELAALAQEIDLDADDIQALRDELAGLGVDVVDPLSLALSLEGSRDERIELALEQMEEALPW